MTADDLKLVDEKRFGVIKAAPGDELHLTYHNKGEVLYDRTFKFDTRKGFPNVLRVYQFKEFEGLYDGLVVVVGYDS